LPEDLGIKGSKSKAKAGHLLIRTVKKYFNIFRSILFELCQTLGIGLNNFLKSFVKGSVREK